MKIAITNEVKVVKKRSVNIYRDGQVIGYVEPAPGAGVYDNYDDDNGVELGYVYHVYNAANKRIISVHNDDRGVSVFFNNYEERMEEAYFEDVYPSCFEDSEDVVLRKIIEKYYNR